MFECAHKFVYGIYALTVMEILDCIVDWRESAVQPTNFGEAHHERRDANYRLKSVFGKDKFCELKSWPAVNTAAVQIKLFKFQFIDL